VFASVSGVGDVLGEDGRYAPPRVEGRDLLELARVAAIRGQPETFRDGVRNARELLGREFDLEAPGVQSAVASLGEMLELEIAPARPDISGSLNLLRGLPAGGE
jgi:uncharacterized protein HemX